MMKMNNCFFKLTTVFLILIFTKETRAQHVVDTLNYHRNIFNTTVYLGGYKQPYDLLKFVYSETKSIESKRLLAKSRMMRAAGAFVGLAGLGLGVDALIGEKHSTIINDKEYTYYKRPIFQLLGGIGLLTAGVSLIEFGNDTKIKSVRVHNERINKTRHQLGLTSGGDIKFTLTF